MGDSTALSVDGKFINNVINDPLTTFENNGEPVSSQFANIINNVMTKPIVKKLYSLG